MPTDPWHVCLAGKTGTDEQMVKTTRLTQLGHCLVSTTASPPASESAQSLLRCARFEADHHLLSFREVCMTRRDFIILLGAAVFVLPRDNVAQPSARTYRLGTLTGNVALSVNSPDGATLLN